VHEPTDPARLLGSIRRNQIIRLLEDDTLLQAEIDRRKEAIRNTDPRRQRHETLRRNSAFGKNIERLITAYQEGLLSLSHYVKNAGLE